MKLNVVQTDKLEKAVAQELKIQDPKEDLIEGIINENTEKHEGRGCSCTNKEDCKKTST